MGEGPAQIQDVLGGMLGPGGTMRLNAHKRALALWMRVNGDIERKHTCGAFIKAQPHADPLLVIYLDSRTRVVDFNANREIYLQRLASQGMPLSKIEFKLAKDVPARSSAEEEAEMILQEYWNPLSACFGGRTVRQYRDGSLAEGLGFLTGIIPRGSKVLDCGCGAGTVSVALNAAGYSAEGIDSSQWMVDEARRTAETLGLDIRYTLGRMEELPFEDGTFDAVVFRNSLYASDDPETALSEAKRVLRDGGILVIEDGNWVATIDHLKKTDYLRGVQAIDARTDLGFGGTDVVDSVLMAKPLSSESRPYWDVAKLEELGFSDIDCSEADDILLAPGEEFVGRGFVVKSVKWSQVVE